MVNYDTSINTLLAGIGFKASESFRIDLDIAWNRAEASFATFRFPRGEAFAANKPNQAYDFSRAYLNSDIDLERTEFALEARYDLLPGRWILGGYRYVDFEDRAPYLFDGTGSIDFYSLAFGWSFG